MICRSTIFILTAKRRDDLLSTAGVQTYISRIKETIPLDPFLFQSSYPSLPHAYGLGI